MAISRVNNGSGSSTSSSLDVGTLTSGALVLFIYVNSKTGTCTITYNGVSMTNVNSVANTGSANFKLFSFVMFSPPNGSHTLAITESTGSFFFRWASYSGVRPSVDANGTNTVSSAASISNSVTTVSDNAWIIAGVDYPGGGTASSGTNWTLLTDGTQIAIGDTNGAVSPAGSTSQTANFSPSQTVGIMIAQIALAPSLAYTLALNQGSYTLTGFALLMNRGYTLIAVKGSYVLTGFATLFTLFQKWIRQTKNSSNVSNQTKHSTAWTDQSKNTSTFNNQTKN